MILTLRELGEPSHYTAIAERTNNLLPPEQQTSARNIHAHLHRRSDIFIRVGRGIFGLRGAFMTASKVVMFFNKTKKISRAGLCAGQVEKTSMRGRG